MISNGEAAMADIQQRFHDMQDEAAADAAQNPQVFARMYAEVFGTSQAHAEETTRTFLQHWHNRGQSMELSDQINTTDRGGYLYA